MHPEIEKIGNQLVGYNLLNLMEIIQKNRKVSKSVDRQDFVLKFGGAVFTASIFHKNNCNALFYKIFLPEPIYFLFVLSIKPIFAGDSVLNKSMLGCTL